MPAVTRVWHWHSEAGAWYDKKLAEGKTLKEVEDAGSLPWRVIDVKAFEFGPDLTTVSIFRSAVS